MITEGRKTRPTRQFHLMPFERCADCLMAVERRPCPCLDTFSLPLHLLRRVMIIVQLPNTFTFYSYYNPLFQQFLGHFLFVKNPIFRAIFLSQILNVPSVHLPFSVLQIFDSKFVNWKSTNNLTKAVIGFPYFDRDC